MPGSTMLFGEHAALAGYPAIACAVSAKMQARFEPNASRRVEVRSALGNGVIDLDHPRPIPGLAFVSQAVARCQPAQGGILSIRSDLPSTVGLGTSAAVCAAGAAVLMMSRGEEPQKQQVLKACVEIIRSVQGRGSGCDAAASIFGRTILYEGGKKTVRTLPSPGGMSLHYCGYKRPTAQVLAAVEEKWRSQPARKEAIIARINDVVTEAQAALEKQDEDHLADCMNRNHALLTELGVEDETLAKLRQKLLNEGATAVKISGSGLGDCLLALGHPNAAAIEIAPQGLVCETTIQAC